MRWARERGLPIHRMPGGKQGTVFAFEHELATWALSHPDMEETGAEAATPPTGEETAPVLPAPPTPSSRRRWWMAAAMLAGGMAVAAVVLVVRAGSGQVERQRLAMPRDPEIARDFMAARDLAARRAPGDLHRAIGLYRSINRRDPGFAPAHAGLAEAWLVYREYGMAGDAAAYGAARAAARRALALNPDLSSAHRAIGFIDYWWQNDGPSAVRAFKRAIAIDADDPQNHFWYANVLADLGADAAAEREYRHARLLSPGTRPIEVEYACAQWQAGRDALALRLMRELAQRYPDDATIHNCLAWIHISRGDMTAFVDAYAEAAKRRREPELTALVARMQRALRTGPQAALDVLIADQRRQMANGSVRIRETPAFFASAMGDRRQLVALLTEASRLGEKWYARTIAQRIGTRWKDDRQVLALLRSVAVRPMATDDL